MITALNLSTIPFDTSSDRLYTPTESTSLRRLSDSIVCRVQDKLAKESETELCQLRQWASEAMKARPDYMQHQPIMEKDDDKNDWTHRTTSERSPSPPLEGQSEDARRSYFLLNGFQARPSSMIATMPSIEQSLASPSCSMASLSTLERSACVRRKPERRRITSSPETSQGKGATNSTQDTPKLQTGKTLLPSLYPSDQEDKSIPTSPIRGSRSKAHCLHLNLAPGHSILHSPDEMTPRGKGVMGLSSPSWTSSTSESEDDKFNLMTPSDGQSPLQRKHAAAVLSQQDMERGLDNLGSSAEHTMHSMTGITLAGRRGSLSTNATKNKVSFALPKEDENLFQTMSPPLATAPAIKHSMLFDVGSVNGITPPALRDHTSYSTDSPSSQVVSAGLEMGLGVTMAVTALSSNMPTTAFSSINTIAEPRFSHNAVPLSSRHTLEYDQVGREISFARLNREEAELARRRTTGGVPANRKQTGIVGIRRHIRAGTHDPRSTGTTFSTLGHQTIDSAILPEGAPYHAEGAALRLDTSDSIRQRRSDSSDGFSASSADASTGLGSTPTGTPFGSHKGMVSPDASMDLNHRSYISAGVAGVGQGALSKGKVDHNMRPAAAAEPIGKIGGGLLGIGGGGHFGPGVRAKISQVLVGLIEGIPLLDQGSETVHLVEYGSLNSRSSQLMQPIISAFVDKQAKRCQQLISSQNIVLGEECHQNGLPSLSFQVTHEDSSSADFRPLTQLLDHSSESYLDSQWQNSLSPSLTNAIFSSFAARPFASRIAPPNTFHAGISLMDLHWIHTPSASISPALTAQAELTTFLSARGSEFKKGGLFIMAYIARSEEAVGPLSQHKDIWTTLSNMLAPCIQRLVSCSMVKSEVARHLLNLPMHPRSAKQTKSVLQSVDSMWKVEWSCGLEDEEIGSSGLPSEPLPLRLPHPAWKAYNSGTLSRIPFTEHMVQLFKNLYESHFRNVLREKGKLTKGAVEFVLDSLWDVLFSRIVDQEPSPMKNIEVEVSIIALRRR